MSIYFGRQNAGHVSSGNAQKQNALIYQRNLFDPNPDRIKLISFSCLLSFLNLFSIPKLKGGSVLTAAMLPLPIAFPMIRRFGLMKRVS